jgi:hypothetical protein
MLLVYWCSTVVCAWCALGFHSCVFAVSRNWVQGAVAVFAASWVVWALLPEEWVVGCPYGAQVCGVCNDLFLSGYMMCLPSEPGPCSQQPEHGEAYNVVPDALPIDGVPVQGSGLLLFLLLL